MKKSGLLILILILSSFFALVLVQAQEGLDNQISDSQEQIEQIINTTETKWDYLSRHWKIVLLQNPVIKAIDSAFTSLDKTGFFIILFGIHWDLSFAVIFSIALWIFLLFYIKKQLHKSYANLSNFYSYLVSLGFVLILAQLKILYKIGQNVFELFTTTKGKIILFISFIVIFLVLSITNKYGKRMQKSRETEKKVEEGHRLEKHEEFYKGVEEGRKF